MRKFLTGLLVVIGFAGLILVTFGMGKLGWGGRVETETTVDRIPPTPVSLTTIERESLEITDSYSGMIRPMERFSLGFDIGGRVIAMGTNAAGAPLDEGDSVRSGDLLVRLDDRVLVALLKESKAQLEQAQSDFNRIRKLRESRPEVISETAFQAALTAQALAEARIDMAEKNLEDASLVSPVDAVISRRTINVGESVGAHQTVLELIQVDEVLLVIGVPEAYIVEIRPGQPVHVELLGRNRFRRKRPQLDGHVRRVAQAADDTTGLFDVEVILANPDGLLKPGLIGLAHVVVETVQGYRIPEAAVVFRENETFLFSVDSFGVAHEFAFTDWIEEGPDLILSELPPEHRRIVVRGQHRLVDGREVEEVDLVGDTRLELSTETTMRTTTTVTRP